MSNDINNKGFYLYILKNKVAVLLIIILLSGIGYKLSESMPKGVLPNIFFPRVEVSIDNGYLPISSMLLTVTKPTEQALKTVQSVEKIVSTTSAGSTDINMYFNWDIDPYIAYQLVLSRVAEIKNIIDPNAKITVRQSTPSIYPVSIYSIGSDSMSRAKLTQKLYYELKPIMLSIPGVYDIEIKAASSNEYKLIIDTEKVAEYKLNINDIINQLQAQNNVDFLGIIQDKHVQYILSLNQKNKNVDEILNLNISIGSKKSIKLNEIALLLESESHVKAMSASSGFKNSVVFNLLRQPNANSMYVQKEFNKKIAELNKKLSKTNINIRKYYDGTNFIKKSVDSVIEAIVLGSLIAIIIIFFFLRKLTISLVALLIIPATFFITMIGMKVIGIDFNIFSLAGMVAALGGLIDHMLIVIENIERHYESGKTKTDAIINGAREIIPVMSVATVLSVLIFVPLLFVSGIVGEFFRQLAIVLVITYLVSQLIATFLTPIIAYITLPNQHVKHIDFMKRFIDTYKILLNKSFDYSWISIPIIIICLSVSTYLYTKTPSTFLPRWDEGNIVIDLVLPSGTSIKESNQEFKQIGNILDTIDEVKNWTMRIGTGLGSIKAPENNGDFLVTLKTDRQRNSLEVIEDIRLKIRSKISNIEELGISQVLEDRIGDIMGADAPISIMLFGLNPNELVDEGYKLQKTLKNLKNIEEVNVLTSFASPLINIKYKSIALSRYGIDKNMIKTQIRSFYYGDIVTSIENSKRPVNLRVLVSRPNIDPISYLNNGLKIYSPILKKNIPLNSVAIISYENKVSDITHYNLSPVCILGVRFKGDNISSVVSDIKKTINKTKIPDNITVDIGGLYKEQQKSFIEMKYIILSSATILFIGLLLKFNSFSISFSILMSLVLTSTGVFTALYITKSPLDIMAFMGILIVLSIVINNNILIFDFFQKNLDNDIDKTTQLIEAIALRVKPILMTMISNALALLPIAMTIGAGTDIIRDLAIAMMGGLFFAIIINLYIIPLFFHFINKRSI